jgi:activator of HSP90 ATPase
VTVEGDSRDADDMKDIVRRVSIPILKQKVPKFIEELKQTAFERTRLQLKQEGTVNKLDKLENLVQTGATTVVAPKIVPVTQGVAASAVNGSAPSSPSVTPSPTPPPAKPAPATTAKPATPTPVTSTSSGASKAASTSFTLSEKFVCRPMDLFECFMDENRVRAYAGGDARVSREAGGKFSLFGGAVQGELVELEPAKRITQKWRFSHWPEGKYSNVKIEFEEKSGKTVLKLEHTNLPADDKERTEQGWRSNFFVRIRGVFGYGGFS